MNEYELIYEELCERVECGELSLEDAEIINDVAYDRYMLEDKSDIERYNSDRIFNLHTGKNRRIAPDGVVMLLGVLKETILILMLNLKMLLLSMIMVKMNNQDGVTLETKLWMGLTMQMFTIPRFVI